MRSRARSTALISREGVPRLGGHGRADVAPTFGPSESAFGGHRGTGGRRSVRSGRRAGRLDPVRPSRPREGGPRTRSARSRSVRSPAVMNHKMTQDDRPIGQQVSTARRATRGIGRKRSLHGRIVNGRKRFGGLSSYHGRSGLRRRPGSPTWGSPCPGLLSVLLKDVNSKRGSNTVFQVAIPALHLRSRAGSLDSGDCTGGELGDDGCDAASSDTWGRYPVVGTTLRSRANPPKAVAHRDNSLTVR